MKRQPKHIRPAGLSPGTLTVSPTAEGVSVRVIRFGPDQIEEHSAVEIADLPDLMKLSPVTWVDVTGLGDAGKLRELGDLFGLHALALEDIAHVGQRPKIELFGNDLLIFVRMTDETVSLDQPHTAEQLCLLVRPGLVVTFQERPGDAFDPVRRRIRVGKNRLRASGADYLAYALLDAVVDRYTLLVDEYETLLESFEEDMLSTPSESPIEPLHHVRRDLITLRRTAAPVREILTQLTRSDDVDHIFRQETRVFVRDCLDHAARAVEQIDASRELVNSLMELYLSMVSHRTNEAMKTLTVIATLFIPLSFIAGLYGMNFDPSSPWNMPELGWRYGYPGALTLMAGVCVGLLAFLKRKGWF